MHAKSHNTMYGNVDLEDITNATSLDVVTQDTDPHLPSFQYYSLKIKGKNKGNTKPSSPR